MRRPSPDPKIEQLGGETREPPRGAFASGAVASTSLPIPTGETVSAARDHHKMKRPWQARRPT